ncbi:MAG TPA: hypothetical protein VFW02_07150 [Candidatus Limnocylindrales bacterium]|nr:hypothetical protein [Candidatus Limnocylindrales bacterium]
MADPALQLLLDSDEPAIRHAALTELLDRPPDDPDVAAARAAIPTGPIVAGLVAGQEPDGQFGVHPYTKWSGAHWRLVSLMDLGVPGDLPSLAAAHDGVLAWLGPGHERRVPIIDGRARRCGSQEGNALATGVHLGRDDDPRVRRLAANLVRWQWPDGGWNCDKKPAARHSSFNESCPPLLGLARFAAASDDRDAAAAADRAAEFLLRHRVAFSERTGELASPSIGLLHYPPFWHYDLLAGLRVLVAAGRVGDPRASDALDLLESKRRPDGSWQPGARWWRSPGSRGSNVEVVDWGGRGSSEPLTLSGLRVLKAAGRWRPPT